MMRRALPVVVAAAVVLALAACTAPPPPRTTPNQVERTALQQAVDLRGLGTVATNVPWVQLWTLRQFADQMQDCAAAASHGQLEVNAGPLIGSSVQYHIVGSGSEPNEVEAGRIIQACREQTPVDARVLDLPVSRLPELYSYDLTVLRPCLLAHGYPIARTPSRAQFILFARAQVPWSPYDTVVVRTRADWYAVSDACPSLPSTLTRTSAHAGAVPGERTATTRG